MNDYFVYILESVKTGRFYIGSTQHVEERLRRHNAGHVHSTRNYRPYVIKYSERFSSRQAAVKREYEIKRYKGGNAFKKLIQK